MTDMSLLFIKTTVRGCICSSAGETELIQELAGKQLLEK